MGNSPRVRHVRVGPGVFVDGLLSFTHQWDGGTELLDHGGLSSQRSCLHGQAQQASLFIRRPGSKAGLWFMGQFSLDSSDIISAFDGILKTQFGIFFFLTILIQRQISGVEEYCIFLKVLK